MTEGSDDALLAELRLLWQEIDPVPAELADEVVAALAIEEFAREWDLLALVTGTELAAVRGDADTLTLQFSDGATSVMVYVAGAAGGPKRVDGWVDGQAIVIELRQDAQEWTTTPNETGRFAFDRIPAGLSRLRLVIRQPDGSQREYRTPQFEV